MSPKIEGVMDSFVKWLSLPKHQMFAAMAGCSRYHQSGAATIFSGIAQVFCAC